MYIVKHFIDYIKSFFVYENDPLKDRIIKTSTLIEKIRYKIPPTISISQDIVNGYIILNVSLCYNNDKKRLEEYLSKLDKEERSYIKIDNTQIKISNY